VDSRVQVVGNVKDKAEAEKQAQIKKDQLAFDLETQMSTEIGRRYVWRVLKKLGYNSPIVEINAKVYGAVAKQEVALDIAKELKVTNRQLFFLMETENEKER